MKKGDISGRCDELIKHLRVPITYQIVLSDDEILFYGWKIWIKNIEKIENIENNKF